MNQYPRDIKPLYKSDTDLSKRVSYLNPAWNERVDAIDVDVSARAMHIDSDIDSTHDSRPNSKKLHY